MDGCCFKKLDLRGLTLERLHLIASYLATRDNTEIISFVRYELFNFDPISRYETHWSAFARIRNLSLRICYRCAICAFMCSNIRAMCKALKMSWTDDACNNFVSATSPL